MTAHPGTFVAERMSVLGWDACDLAFVLGNSGSQLRRVLNGTSSVTAQMATNLGAALDIPADAILDRQVAYNLGRDRNTDEGVKIRSKWVSAFPIREMIRRGWIEDVDASSLDSEMMRFFGVAKLDDVPMINAELDK